MYQVKRNGKKSVRKLFESYDAARIYVRKLIRRREALYDPVHLDLYSNPNLSEFGYSISKV